MSKWIRKGDRVVILAGNDKGKTGEVMARVEDRLLVQGVNLRKKHVRPTSQGQGKGQIIEKESPIHVSNVAVADESGSPLSLSVRFEGGVKQLVGRSLKAEAIHRNVKKGSR